jgi:hypothetical protein
MRMSLRVISGDGWLRRVCLFHLIMLEVANCVLSRQEEGRRGSRGAEEAQELLQVVCSRCNARPAKASRGAGLKSTNAGAAAVIPDEYLPPNKILFVQNLPEEYDIDA